MPVSPHYERGQTLPVVAIGLIAMLAFAYFALDYANTIRWQMRAQSAADSAAQAILTIQTQEFNEMTATLYAGAVEEYRLRRNLNAMVMAANQQGGCSFGYAYNDPIAVWICGMVYGALQPYFMRSVARYGADVTALNKITATLTLTNVEKDGRALLNQMSTQCNGSVAGDCAFTYYIPPNGIQPRTPTYAVKMDALRLLKPEYGSVTELSGVADVLAPIQVEVETCANIPPLLPRFFGYAPKVNQVIGRGAATAVMMEQDWLQPGTITNPKIVNGMPFQVAEGNLHGYVVTDPSTGYDWYDLNFGGNGNHAYTGPTGGYSEALLNDEFSVQLGWWNSMPIHTFLGELNATALGCNPLQ